MVKLVSLEQAKNHLRVDTSDDDSGIILSIEASSKFVIDYIVDHSFLDSSGEPEYDSAGDPLGVPTPIQQAVLILIGCFYSDRIGEEFIQPKGSADFSRVGILTLPRVVQVLLDQYRKPVME